MNSDDQEIWKRVVARRRQDFLSLDTVISQKFVKELLPSGGGLDSISPADRIEIQLCALYNIAADPDRESVARRKAFEEIQTIRKRLDEELTRNAEPKPSSSAPQAVRESTNLDESRVSAASENGNSASAKRSVPTTATKSSIFARQTNGETTNLEESIVSSASGTRNSTSAKRSVTTTATNSSSSARQNNGKTTNLAESTASAALKNSKSTSEKGVAMATATQPSTKPTSLSDGTHQGKGKGKTFTESAKSSEHSGGTAAVTTRRTSLTATLATTSAKTTAEAASAAPDPFPSRESSNIAGKTAQKTSAYVGVSPPPYQRTSAAVAQEKARIDTKRGSSSRINGTNHPVQNATQLRSVSPQTSNGPGTQSSLSTMLSKASIPSSAVRLTTTRPTRSPDTTTAASKKRRREQELDEMDISHSDDDENHKEKSSKKTTQEPPANAANLAKAAPKPLPSSFTLDTTTKPSNYQVNVLFPADRKEKGFTTNFSCAQNDRFSMRTYFKRVYASDEMLMGAGRLFAMWEPNWQVERIVATGVTSRIEKIEKTEQKPGRSPASPNTAATMELPGAILSSQEFDKLSWGVKRPSGWRPKDGDSALLLRMLPVEIDPKYKNKRANCHLWPKGTFLMVDGQPIMIVQRKQASHDYKKWEYLCHPVDLATFIGKALRWNSHTVAMCCHDQAQYVFVAALCSFKSPATLTKRLMEPNNDILERLDYEDSVEKAMNYINQHSVTIDDGDESSESDLGKLIFSLVDPVTKVPMNVPVRGRGCRHFQCFDLESYMTLNATVSGGRWRCLCCENFITHQELEVCGLTQAALTKFSGTASSVRDRVIFRADKTYDLLPEQEGKYAKRRAQAAATCAQPKSQNKQETSSSVSNAKGFGGPTQPIEVIELD